MLSYLSYNVVIIIVLMFMELQNFKNTVISSLSLHLNIFIIISKDIHLKKMFLLFIFYYELINPLLLQLIQIYHYHPNRYHSQNYHHCHLIILLTKREKNRKVLTKRRLIAPRAKALGIQFKRGGVIKIKIVSP